MSDDGPSLPMAWASLGDVERKYDLRYPTLEADGGLHFHSEDGDDHLVTPVRTASHYHQAFPVGVTLAHSLNSIGREKNSFILHKLELVVTDARVIVHMLDPKQPGKRLVGHLWYPWIAGVGFRPKQSFLNDAAISLEFREDFPLKDRGMWWERLELLFEKTFHPGPLAQEIAHRIAAHHLKHGVPEAARESLEALLTTGPLADPAKGELATYYPSAYVGYPGGVPYAEWKEPIAWEWTLSGVEAAEAETDVPGEEGDVSGVAAAAANGDLPAAEGAWPATVSDEPLGGPAAAPEAVASPLPRLGLKERLAMSKDVMAAQRAFDAEQFDVAAAKYQAIVDRLTAAAPIMQPAQVVDLFERAAISCTAIGRIDDAVENCRRALEISAREHDESLEIDTRGYLAQALEHVDRHDLLVPNLRRLSELIDSHRTRTERAQSHGAIARELDRVGEDSAAVGEYQNAARLCEAVGDFSGAGEMIVAISFAFRRHGAIEDARSALQDARALFERAGDQPQVARTDARIAALSD